MNPQVATPSSFPPFLDSLLDKLAPPPWAVQEAQQRLVLALNHVLMQEPEAQSRLLRQNGRTASVQWRSIAINFIVTPAGLLDRHNPDEGKAPDLALTVMDASPLDLLRKALSSAKPDVRIEGDVQLAAEINWLVDHVRWDYEEDLSRLLGDGPAHAIGQALRGAASALRRFAPQKPVATAA